MARPAPSAFLPLWRGVFDACPPIGFALRETHFERWTRFHALPGSKRYAETPAERAEYRARANRLAEEVLGAPAPISISTARFGNDPPEPDGPEHRLRLAPVLTWVEPEDDPEDERGIGVHAGPFDWRPGSLDALFDEIGADQVSAVLFSPRRETLLAPYEGGFDVLLPDPQALARLQARHPDWRPPDPHGL